MARTYKKKLVSGTYRNYSEGQLAEALRAINAGTMSLRKAHNIPLETLSQRVQGKHSNPPGCPTVITEREEAYIVDHLKAVSEWGFPFDFTDLRLMVKSYLSKVDRTVPQFKENIPSEEWAHNFMKRHKNELSTRRCQNI